MDSFIGAKSGCGVQAEHWLVGSSNPVSSASQTAGATRATILGSEQNTLPQLLTAWISTQHGEPCPLAFSGGTRGLAVLL